MSAPAPPVWCHTCGIHLALPHIKHCPVCLDQRARKDQK